MEEVNEDVREIKNITPHKEPEELEPGDYISIERSPETAQKEGRKDHVVCRVTHNSNGYIRLFMVHRATREEDSVNMPYEEFKSKSRKYVYLGKKKDFWYRLINFDVSMDAYYFPEDSK